MDLRTLQVIVDWKASDVLPDDAPVAISVCPASGRWVALAYRHGKLIILDCVSRREAFQHDFKSAKQEAESTSHIMGLQIELDMVIIYAFNEEDDDAAHVDTIEIVLLVDSVAGTWRHLRESSFALPEGAQFVCGDTTHITRRLSDGTILLLPPMYDARSSESDSYITPVLAIYHGTYKVTLISNKARDRIKCLVDTMGVSGPASDPRVTVNNYIASTTFRLGPVSASPLISYNIKPEHKVCNWHGTAKPSLWSAVNTRGLASGLTAAPYVQTGQVGFLIGCSDSYSHNAGKSKFVSTMAFESGKLGVFAICVLGPRRFCVLATKSPLRANKYMLCVYKF
jgi:hypothetical protein